MFYIDPDSGIACGGESDGDAFDSLTGLTGVAELRQWSKQDVTAIWNGFAGTAGPFAELKPVKMFRNRPYGLKTIWGAIQRLAPSDAASEPAAAEDAKIEEKPMKKTKKAKALKKPAEVAVKSGSKKSEVIRLMSRKNGVSGSELQEAMGWLPHTTRGLISTLKSKGGLSIISEKHETRGMVYRIAS